MGRKKAVPHGSSSALKRPGRRNIDGGLPPSISDAGVRQVKKMRMRMSSLIGLLERISDLERENRELKVGIVVDLRLAAGILKDSERAEAVQRMMNPKQFTDDVLAMLRSDLIKVLARINNVPAANETTPRDRGDRSVFYVA